MKTFQAICFWTIAAVALCIPFTGCTGKSANDTAVYVLFDTSGSTNSTQVRQGYLHDLKQIQDAIVANGGVMRGDVIGAEARNNSTVPLSETISPEPSELDIMGHWLSDDAKRVKDNQAAAADFQKQVDTVLNGAAPASSTAIMDSLSVVGKVLNGDQLKNARFKALVVFSDMLEESPRYNFTRETLTDARIQAIVSAEKSSGRLPDLQGVKVWKSGFSAEHLSDERSRQLEKFWEEYFKASGADLQPDHYGSSLLNFSLE